MRRSTNPRGTVRETKEFFGGTVEDLVSMVRAAGVEKLSDAEVFSEDDYIYVIYKRPETDAEMNKRIEREKRDWEVEQRRKAEEKAKKDKRDLAEYERLKRKFESK